jgi:hypothetical protein
MLKLKSIKAKARAVRECLETKLVSLLLTEEWWWFSVRGLTDVEIAVWLVDKPGVK